MVDALYVLYALFLGYILGLATYEQGTNFFQAMRDFSEWRKVKSEEKDKVV